MLNTLTFDHIDNLVYPPTDYIDMEEYYNQKQIIFKQLQDLDNLGVNLLKDVEEGEIKNKIYKDIIDYSRDNYLNIMDRDYIMNNAQLSQTANLIYQFLCVDGFNILVPRIIEHTNVQNIEQFDRLLFHNKKDINYVKKQIINNLSDIVNNLLKLQKFDHVIAEDEHYKELINRFGNYLEMIDFSDCDTFLNNYLRPLLNKYFSQILWRTLAPIN